MSTITIDPPIAGGLPPLPPFLQPKRRDGGRWIILPDICRLDATDTVFDRNNNWKTDIYRYMSKFDTETKTFIDLAHTSTRKYRQWLETYQTEDGIPPHISFGGAIVAGKGDPTFHSRWKEYALATFC